MRRFLLFLELALVAFAAPLRAQTVVVGVGGELSGLKNEEIRVPVFADMRSAGGEKLGSYTIRVSWNPNVLSFVGGESGTFAEALGNLDTLGVLWLTGMSATGADGVLDLVVGHFYVDSADTTPIDIQVTELSAAGTLTDLLPIVTVVPGTFCPALGRWGDVDGDTRSNSRDALAILSDVVDLEGDTTFNLAMGDVDGDGNVNTRDALIILSYAVGIQIPGQRVLLVAGGSCAAQETPSIVVVPDTVDLVGDLHRGVNQEVQLLALGRNASGEFVTLTGVNWESADPLIAFVTAEGDVFGVDSGTTTITAGIGPGITVTVPVIVRARRPVWYVDALKAKRATVQLGTQEWPFSTPERAFELLSEGDTIRIAPGIHDYEALYTELDVGAVIIGDTLTDGTRPILRAAESDYLTAFDWERGDRGEVRNLILRGFYNAVVGAGVRNLVLDNVRVEEPRTAHGSGIQIYDPIDTVMVLNSELLADTTLSSYEGLYIGDGAQLVVVDSSTFLYWGDGGIYGYDVDSLDLRRSEISYTDYRGVYLNASNRPSVSAAISYTRFIDNYYEAIKVYDARVVALDHNFILEARDDAIEIAGVTPVVAGSKVTSLGDSVQFQADDWDWIDIWDMDSVLIDSLWYENAPDIYYEYGYIDARYVEITNSEFLNLFYDPLDVYTRELLVDNSVFSGCPSCTWDADVLYVRGFAGVGPKITLTNSTFSNVYHALSSTTVNDSAGPMVITGNVVDSVYYGFRVNGDSLLITDDTLTNVYSTGIYAQPSYTAGVPLQTAAILRNQITCALSSADGIRSDDAPTRIEDNGVRDCDYGIWVDNSAGQPRATLSILRDTVFTDTLTSGGIGIRFDGLWEANASENRVRYGDYGIYVATADTAPVVMDSNAVSYTATAGVWIFSGTPAISGRKNNISWNQWDGVLNAIGAGPAQFTLGRFVHNGRYAVNNLDTASFGATQDWWGNAAGPGPGADSVSGTVDASSPLASDPGDVPALAPPMFTAAASGPLSRPAATAGQEARARQHSDPEAEARAGLERKQQKQARQAEREATKEAEWAARRAAREQRKAQIEQIRQQRRLQRKQSQHHR